MSEIVTGEHRRGVLVAHCHGALDLATRDRLRRALTDLAPPGAGPLVVDLGDVTFMDCSALGVLIALGNRHRRTGTPLLVCAPRPIVRRLLTVLAVDRTLVVVPTADDAVALAATWADLAGTGRSPARTHRRRAPGADTRR